MITFLSMEPPRSYKDVQRLTGRLAALSRFISKSGDPNLLFFQETPLGFQEEFVWDSQCDVAFEELKRYLGSPKLLTRPEEGEELQRVPLVVYFYEKSKEFRNLYIM
ncbi:hypothetical protein LIER_16607 [Lithospermum erythrorhizon]|uniref:Uncharacterized protein n=1 Tax=Lithospermum erythrorhizon TaxID=34254 RepID=A0AAV3Q8R8_LITER